MILKIPPEIILNIQNLIAKMIGIKSKEISYIFWEKLILARMDASANINPESYYSYLLTSTEEKQELIEKLIVSESWFFRDHFVFDKMVELLQRKKNLNISLLSIPCAAGEEPYSMAMALLDASFSSSHFQIDAYDNSQCALKEAKMGIYTENAFREEVGIWRGRYFDKNKSHYLLKKEVRNLVRFGYGNIYNPNFMNRNFSYDIIFCRNLLIYLHQEAQERVLRLLKRLLKEDGVLFVSPAEAMLVKQFGFETEKMGRIFIWPRKNKKTIKEREKKSEVKKKAIQTIELPLESTKAAQPFAMEKKELNPLNEAKELADKGMFAEAERVCLQHLQVDIMDAEAHFLLGVIRHALGAEESAEKHFTKAAYLQPNHHEALTYLYLLAEKQGDIEKADLLRRRLKNLDAFRIHRD